MHFFFPFNLKSIIIFYSGHLNFGIFSPEQMRKLAHLHVVSQSLYSQDLARKPVLHGVLDRRMVLANIIVCRNTIFQSSMSWFAAGNALVVLPIIIRH